MGKYTGLLDAYNPLSEALDHGGIANNVKVNMNWIDSEIFERNDTLHELRGSTVFLSRAASVKGELREKSQPLLLPVNTGCHILAFVLECRSLWLKQPVIWQHRGGVPQSRANAKPCRGPFN